MKRNMDKVRSVLLALEEIEGAFITALKAAPLGDTKDWAETIEYLRLLESAGYVENSGRSSYRMTWAGHEFLETVRDPEIWSKTKEGANKLGSWSIKLLSELAIGFARAKAQELGLPIG